MAASYPNRQNCPIPVEWGGFRSDTRTLGRHGWQIAIDEQLYSMRLAIVMHHPKMLMTAYGEMQDSMAWRRFQRGMYSMSPESMPPFVIQHVSVDRHLHVNIMEPFDLADFHRIDTEPTIAYTSSPFEELPLFSKLFAPIPEAKELIVDPADVQSMLDQILKIQAPMMKDIRARDRGRDYEQQEARQVHAQIITLERAA